jgi:hypothetical protein
MRCNKRGDCGRYRLRAHTPLLPYWLSYSAAAIPKRVRARTRFSPPVAAPTGFKR